MSFATAGDDPLVSPATARALLEWYVAMGVDLALDGVAHDRFAEGLAPAGEPLLEAASDGIDMPVTRSAPPETAHPPSLQASPAVARAPSVPALDAAAAAAAAGRLAAGAATLDDLRAVMDAFDGCALKRTASRLVFADGNRNAPIMLVGEAPGGDEDRQGVPFAGKTGELLDAMLRAIGLDRQGVYLANVVPWRPPGNRAPTAQETAICLPFVRRQIALASPALIVCLGKISMQALLGLTAGIAAQRGKWADYLGDDAPSIPALTMFHPKFLLQAPAHKRETWHDLLALKSAAERLTP